MAIPEKLNLWDRIFNRYRLIVIDEGEEEFPCDPSEYYLYPIHCTKRFVRYRKIDRLTGFEEIIKKYV